MNWGGVQPPTPDNSNPASNHLRTVERRPEIFTIMLQTAQEIEPNVLTNRQTKM